MYLCVVRSLLLFFGSWGGEIKLLICASSCLVFCYHYLICYYYFCRHLLFFRHLRVKWPSWRRRNPNTSCLCATFKCHLSLAQRDRMWAPSRDVVCLVSLGDGGVGDGGRKDDGTHNPLGRPQPVQIVSDWSEADGAALNSRLAESQAAAAVPCVNRQRRPLAFRRGMSCTAGLDGVPSRHVDYNLTRQAKRKNGPLSSSGSKHTS